MTQAAAHDGRGTSALERDGGTIAAEVAADYADTDWTVFDSGLLRVTKGGELLLSSLCWWNESQTLFLPHFHLPALVVDGTIIRKTDDPTQGEANLWISQLYNDGSWLALNVRVPPWPSQRGSQRAAALAAVRGGQHPVFNAGASN